jgi:lipopolysaccharide export LptBFGC system permease protein LptF
MDPSTIPGGVDAPPAGRRPAAAVLAEAPARRVRLSLTYGLHVVLALVSTSAVALLAFGVVLGVLAVIRVTGEFDVPLVVALPCLLMAIGSQLMYALPLALVLGTGLVLGRLAADRELLALRSFGVSPGQLLLPVIVLGAAVSGVAFYLNQEWVPRFRLGMRNVESLILDNIKYLGEGWNLDFRFGSQSVWVYHHDGPELEGIFVGVGPDSRGDALLSKELLEKVDDSRYPLYVFAERGRISAEEGSGGFDVVVELRGVSVWVDGGFFRSGVDTLYQDRIYFERLSWRPPSSRRTPGPKDRVASELRAETERRRGVLDRLEQAGDPDAVRKARADYHEALAVYHRRFAISLAALTFPATAFALGLALRSTNRLLPFFVASSIVPGVYFIFSEVAGGRLAASGVLPGVTQQFGNIALLALCGFCLWWAQRAPRR